MVDLRAHGKTYNKYEFINKLLKLKGFLEYFPKARGLISDCLRAIDRLVKILRLLNYIIKNIIF